MKAAISYPGNKGTPQFAHNLINIIPPHTVYWELCLGSGGLSRIKKPAVLNFGVEIDSKIIKKFKNDYQRSLIVINDCAISLAKELQFVPGTHFIYADPPYPKGARRSAVDIYNYEWTDEQHIQFLNSLKKSTASVVISSYDNPLYNDLLQGWNKKTFNVSVHGKRAAEVVYYNYQIQGKLHQYDFVGENKTKRQGIKRKAARWCKRLALQPPEVQEAIWQQLLLKRSHK